jgi:Cu-Zn family superoxide dismutase
MGIVRNAATAASCICVALFVSGAASAADITVTMNAIDGNGVGKKLGTVRAYDTPKGLRLAPRLKGLPAGPHGFHVHEKKSCKPGMSDGKKVAGLGAGGHYDPAGAGKHGGPGGQGHLGDLPVLVAKADGSTGGSLLAPRLKVSDLRGRALMIHAGGDNFSDQPKPLGGGGGRIACGVM